MPAPRGVAIALLSLALAGSAGCAAAPPMLNGGTTTPAGRSDVAFGAAFRLPLGELASRETRSLFQGDAVEAGAVPVLRYRLGVEPGLDAGVTIFGPALALDGRYEFWVDAEHVLRPALSVGASAFAGLFAGGARGGGRISSLLTVSATSLIELWLGPIVSMQGVTTNDDNGDVSAWGLGAGGVVGLAVGFRNFHVLAELAVVHERWNGSGGAGDIGVNGVVLTPAFALRLRL